MRERYARIGLPTLQTAATYLRRIGREHRRTLHET